MTVILTSFSLAWICSICIPWGRGSNGLLSITTSFLCQNSRTSSSGEQCIISSPSPINLSSSCFTKVGHEPIYGENDKWSATGRTRGRGLASQAVGFSATCIHLHLTQAVVIADQKRESMLVP